MAARSLLSMASSSSSLQVCPSCCLVALLLWLLFGCLHCCLVALLLGCTAAWGLVGLVSGRGPPLLAIPRLSRRRGCGRAAVGRMGEGGKEGKRLACLSRCTAQQTISNAHHRARHSTAHHPQRITPTPQTLAPPCAATGDEGLFKESTPWLDVMGKRSLYLGAVGGGARMKLVVNMIMGSMMGECAGCASDCVCE